ncbi:DNA polymerase III [Deinococcus metallilatus]|uniref:DNA polymerase III n=1 Tax=Deinococcus metallilatus TaxID=1211322 RepID=A0AAJ5F427_9DEIO|nr:DNA polymerase III [Deinococcus metallilatus]MBB5294390.1 DNA polymerase III delta prime subunit [Deinococcus metallilatus]QBY10145.1 DNA polymerase III [Deinococcus metallilatus]RXJ13871.1 DNA polymerase III [Deinococcus metallilatus]TLK29837.1 DNA polymerase III [Deinococcus metallilatus]GMA15606.1 DNA polymerase III [Deinococcus metallilatus]
MTSSTALLHGPLLEQTAVFRGNALLLTGPARVGKRDVALAVAAQHNCSGTRGMYGEACGTCPSCRAFAAGAHPDLLLVEPRATTSTGKAARRKLIPIGAILSARDKGREYETHVFEFLEVRPTFRRRVVIVDGAEHLGPEAANALLKLVEEPPHGALFVFLAEDLRSVIPTIVSRSARLSVTPAPDRALERTLALSGEAPDAELVAFAAGRAGVLKDREAVRAALTDAAEFTGALETGLLPALEAAERLEKRWDAAWHPEALRFTWRTQSPHARARADAALDALQAALEAYASPSLSFQVFALNLREAFGEG